MFIFLWFMRFEKTRLKRIFSPIGFAINDKSRTRQRWCATLIWQSYLLAAVAAAEYFLSLNRRQQLRQINGGGGKSWAYLWGCAADAQPKNATLSSNFMNKNKINTRFYFLISRLENMFYINSSDYMFLFKNFLHTY